MTTTKGNIIRVQKQIEALEKDLFKVESATTQAVIMEAIKLKKRILAHMKYISEKEEAAQCQE